MSQEPVRLIATPSQTVGPFFSFGLTDTGSVGCLAGPDTKGERIRLRVAVVDGDGLPVPDALIEIWQADADGSYVRPPDLSTAQAPPRFTGFGRLPTEQDGTCVIETIRPGTGADAQGRRQAPHIDVCLFARGLLRQIYTRIYFAGDDGLDEDPILARVPVDRRHTLIARACGRGNWSFDIRLQGEDETVFFDL
jgi:protocatechuate 3,4-dioxygenase alpha subunit